MKNLQKIWVPLLIAVLAVLTTGCAAALIGGAAGAGAVLYSKGDLKSTEKGSVEEVYQASLEAMDKMKLETVAKNADSLNATILAKMENGDNVDIKIEQKPNDLTELKIRVGAFGDESKARVILDEIRRQLGDESTSGPS